MEMPLAVSDETWAEYEDAAYEWARDTAEWFERHLQIINRNNELVPLVCNDEQMRVLFWVGMQIAAGVPIRLMVLKSRRAGISTVITAMLQMWVVTRPNYSAMAAAHDADGTNTLWEMAKLYRDSLEGTEYDREMDFSNTKAIVYSKPHRSSYRFQTAGGSRGEGKAGIGRSKEITAFHASERAFIPGWKAVVAGVASCIPDTPQSAEFHETTANGATGDFYDDWNRTVASWRANPHHLYCTIPLFFTWLGRADCRRAAPAGYDWGPRDEDEQRLQGLGATDEELYWRRVRIAEKYSGDKETFTQEYPATPEEAFRASGNPAIPAAIIAHHEKQVAKAADRVRLVTLHRVKDGRMWTRAGLQTTDLPDGTVYPRDADGTEPWYWKVLNPPIKGHDYTVFGDVAEGRLADPKNERSDLDFHTGAALNRRELRYDASGKGKKIDPDQHGIELRKLAEWYNMAWASPEANNTGWASLTAFRGYPRLYQRQKGVEHTQEGAEKPLLGFKTDKGNRPHLINEWLIACREHPETGWDNTVDVFDPDLVEEERHFIRRADGKQEHATGYHDDMLFAHMGAWWLHLFCPRVTREVEEIPREPNPGLRLGPPEMYAGGVDSFPARHRDDGGCEETV